MQNAAETADLGIGNCAPLDPRATTGVASNSSQGCACECALYEQNCTCECSLRDTHSSVNQICMELMQERFVSSGPAARAVADIVRAVHTDAVSAGADADSVMLTRSTLDAVTSAAAAAVVAEGSENPAFESMATGPPNASTSPEELSESNLDLLTIRDVYGQPGSISWRREDCLRWLDLKPITHSSSSKTAQKVGQHTKSARRRSKPAGIADLPDGNYQNHTHTPVCQR